MSRSRRAARPNWVPLRPVAVAEPDCVEVPDSSVTSLPTDFLVRGAPARDPAALAARLVDQFRDQNRDVLREIGATVQGRYDGTEVRVEVTTGTTVGAVPLRSPTSGRPELGLVVRPRYDWAGLGAMLGRMGWKVLPAPLALPNLPRSERKVPPWVLSAIVLGRIEVLLRALHRRFEMTTGVLPAPRGQVDWGRYASASLVAGRPHEVPCRFPELTSDPELRGAIHFTLRRHLGSLQTQRAAGAFVVSLVAWAERLLDGVRSSPVVTPDPRRLERWSRVGMRSPALREGLESIAWTAEERGLAGLADLHGLPWALSMEAFFEAWVEAVAARLAPLLGATVRSGRLRQTLTPVSWDPPFTGSQRYLLPDVMLDTAGGAVVLDAKYKDHWEDLAVRRWGELGDDVREHHRADLLQVLAYTAPLDAARVGACLVYPCRRETWESLADRGCLFHRATVGAGGRVVRVLLTALPMADEVSGSFDLFAGELRNLLADR